MNLARRSMNHPALAAVYERAWRPAAFYAASGRTMGADRRDAVRQLRLGGPQRVLDIACGPGNFTKYLSDSLTGGGFAVGLDYSEAMLARAVIDNTGPRVGYLRGDAARLPFADGTFDAVCCFGALYLIPDPLTAAREMVRVLAPNGRIAISTSHRDDSPFGRVSKVVGGLGGLRVFPGATFPGLFAELGLVDIEQQVHRLLQYVSATRPA
ncbi:methyltransferase domain-containing protein [Nocardia sp. NPDC048505]|uniref:class I SAM-dependent methyltransferase n=1 Tax=unclassified Nocardia TaxID=2637762 RepID=UPI0034046B54